MNNVELSKELIHNIDKWADHYISQLKREIYSLYNDGNISEDQTREIHECFCWSEWLFYQKGGDVWSDENWWIETSIELYKLNHDDVKPLEVLLANRFEQYKDLSLSLINQWGLTDADYFSKILAYFYPENYYSKQYFDNISNNYEDTLELIDAVKLGNKQAANIISKIIYDDEDSNFNYSKLIINRFKKEEIFNLLTDEYLSKIHEKFLNISKDTKCNFLDYEDLIKCAFLMDWQDIIDELSINKGYLNQLFNEDLSTIADEILAWSFTNKIKLSQQFSLKLKLLIDNITVNEYVTRYPISKLYLAAAIAWKRSRNIVIPGASC